MHAPHRQGILSPIGPLVVALSVQHSHAESVIFIIVFMLSQIVCNLETH